MASARNLLVVLCGVLVCSCSPDKKTFHKSLQLEVSIGENSSEDGGGVAVQHINAPRILYFNDSVYLRDNSPYGFVLQVLLDQRKAFALSESSPSINVGLVSKTLRTPNAYPTLKRSPFELTYKRSPLNYVLDVAPEFDDGFYVLSDLNAVAYSVHDENATPAYPQVYISRFSKDAEFLYYIDAEGRLDNSLENAQFFNPQHVPYRFFADAYGYLYFISKGFQDEEGKEEVYSLYRYDVHSKLDLYIPNIYTHLAHEEDRAAHIEQVLITPRSQTLLLVVVYYDSNKETLERFQYRELLSFPLSSKRLATPTLIRKLDDKNYSLFGVSLQERIFLHVVPEAFSLNALHQEFSFEIIDMNGETLEMKTVPLPSIPEKRWQWLSLGMDEKIAVFTQGDSKLIGDFYQ